MKNKNLMMGLGFAAFSMAIQAQTTIYSNGFENNEKPAAGTYSSKYALTPGVSIWGDWVNPKEVDNWKEQAEDARSGEYCFEANNGNCGDSFSWDRGFKIANLPIKENTAYRVSFWLQTSDAAKISSWISQGVENFDKSICTPNGTNFGVDSKDFNTNGEWEHVSFVSYYSSQEALLKVIENQSWVGSAEMPSQFGGTGQSYKAFFENRFPNEFFFILNMFTNDVTYKIDDIKIEEGVTFNEAKFYGNAIQLDFGYDTNIAELAKAKGGTLALDPSCVKVTSNGVEVTPESVEGKQDGKLYIFFENDLEATEEIKVSFTPAADCPITYVGEKRPSSDYEAEMKVLGFENETVYMASNEFDQVSSLWDAPKFMSCTPENNSFDLAANDIKNVSITFNKAIDCSYTSAVVKYKDNFGEKSIDIDPKSFSISEDKLTLNIAMPELKDGEYTLVVSDVASEALSTMEDPVEITFEIGSSGIAEAAQTIYASTFDSEMTGGVPQGWYTENAAGVHQYGFNDEARTSQFNYDWGGTPGGGGTRLFDGFSGDFTKALYWGSRESNLGYCTYGQLVQDYLNPDGTLSEDCPEGIALKLEPRKYQITFLMAAWKGAPVFRFTLEDLEGNVYAKFTDFVASPSVEGNKIKVTGSVKCQTDFTVDKAGYYVLKFESQDAQWQEFLLANVNLITMPSKSAYYKNMLNVAIDAAQAAYDAASDPKFDGDAKKALLDEIKKASDTKFTAPSEVEAEVEALAAAKDALDTRVENFDKYNTAKDNIDIALLNLELEDEKYMKSPMAVEAQNLYKQYKDVEPETLNDKDLADATSKLQSAASKVGNIKSAVDALTWGAQKASMIANTFGIKGESVAAVNAAVDDDVQAIHAVNNEIAYALVDKLAKGESIEDLKTNVYNTAIVAEEEEPGMEYNDNYNPLEFKGIDLSSFVRNSHLYRVNGVDGVPGWNLVSGSEEKDLNIGYNVNPDDANPVVDCQINIYGDACYNMSQVIEGLPAGYYTLCIQTRTPLITKDVVLNEGEEAQPYTYYYNAQNDETQVWDKYIYAKGDDDSEGVAPYAGASGLVTTFVKNIKVTNGKIEIGAVENYVSGKAIKHEDHTPQESWTGTTYVDYINLYFVAPVEGFNYSEAATAVEFVDAAANASVAKIYNVGGVRQNNLKSGINIVKYTDGSVRRVYVK